jgi:hypothetical protein
MIRARKRERVRKRKKDGSEIFLSSLKSFLKFQNDRKEILFLKAK